jgi:hypothetical protein
LFFITPFKNDRSIENTPKLKPAPKFFPLIVVSLQMKLYSKRAEEAYADLKLFFKPLQAHF